MIKLSIRYTDACNYKTSFDHVVDPLLFPAVKGLEVGDEIIMGELGTPKKKDFFNSSIHPYMYIDEYDHNILEVDQISVVQPEPVNQWK